MQRKIIQTVAVLVSSLIITACSTTPKVQGDVKQEAYVKIEKSMPLKKIHNLIKEAGEQDGWRMTEFKENALIAEKFSNDSSEVVTIEFSKDSFHLTPENSELESAIAEKLRLF